ASTVATAEATCSSSPASSTSGRPVPPGSEAASAAAPSASTSATTTAEAPSAASRRASAAPIPLAPPATTATAPSTRTTARPLAGGPPGPAGRPAPRPATGPAGTSVGPASNIPPMRYGITVPLPGIPLAEQRDLVSSLPELGYTDVWSAEAGGADAFTPLALASVWAPTLRLGTAIVPVFTRGAATLAQSVAALADAAPGRVAIGLGTSTEIIVRRWNGLPFEAPYARVRDTVRFLRAALSGQRVSQSYETFTVDGFRLQLVPQQPPQLLVAALRPGMLRLAGREADGAVINWLAAEDVPTVVRHVHETGPGKEIVARLFVVLDEDADRARTTARRLIAAYLTVDVYRRFHEWLGRGELLAPMWRAWEAGDRAGAVAAIPDEVVDALVVHGDAARCRDRIRAYAEAGVTTPVVALVPGPTPVAEAVRALAPS